MEKKGNFVLLTVGEFDDWLMNTKFIRAVNLIQIILSICEGGQMP